jgi:hypothetical protein
MNTTSLTETTPPTAEEEKQEDKFEKALADPHTSSPYHLNVYARTFLGGLILLALIVFYVIHISGQGKLGTYGETPMPAVDTHVTNP